MHLVGEVGKEMVHRTEAPGEKREAAGDQQVGLPGCTSWPFFSRSSFFYTCPRVFGSSSD